MKKHILTLIILLTVFLPTQNVSAFDGNRKGFVLSNGIGFTHYRATIRNTLSHYNKAFTYRFNLGYGINNKDIIVLDRALDFSYFNNGLFLEQHSGFSWFHFFKAEKKSYFTKLGYGYYPKDAFYIGGGYMFSNNFQISLSYIEVKNTNTYDNIKLLVSYVAF